MTEDGGKEILHWGRNLGQGGGSCTEHFGFGADNWLINFVGFGFPIPRLDEEMHVLGNPFTNYNLQTEFQGCYSAYINKDGNFVLARRHENTTDLRGAISLRVEPSEIESLVKGLIFQSAKGLGRTSARTLLDMIEYRFSDQFIQFQKQLE